MRKISYKSSLVAVHHWLNNNGIKGNLCWRRFLCGTVTVWPDWAIYCTLGNFSKAVAAIILTKLPIFYAIFVEVSKSFIFLVESILGNFYRHLATFYWSRCWQWSLSIPEICSSNRGIGKCFWNIFNRKLYRRHKEIKSQKSWFNIWS